jgi:hypothetical protein
MGTAIKKGKSGSRTTEESGNMSNESEMPMVAFRKRVEIHNVKLADVYGPWGIANVVSWVCVRARYSHEELLPPPFEDAYTWAVIPTFAPHPGKTLWMGLNDDMLRRMHFLEICVYLISLCRHISHPFRSGSEISETDHPNPKPNIENTKPRSRHAIQKPASSFVHWMAFYVT